MTPHLIVRATRVTEGIRFLTVDPAATTGLLTWSTNYADAYHFELAALPRLLDLVRGKSKGTAVMLITHDSQCSISERNRQVMNPATGRKEKSR